MAETRTDDLFELAHRYGIETAYDDPFGRHKVASPEVLMAVLRALGCPIQSLDDVPEACARHQAEIWRRTCEPVIVVWDGQPLKFEVRVRQELANENVSIMIETENGRTFNHSVSLKNESIAQQAKADGIVYVSKWITISRKLPLGYHQLTMEMKGKISKSLVISAPVYAHSPFGTSMERLWGVFLPLYAVSSNRSWGSGDFTDLKEACNWVAELKGGTVATLPLLASFLDENFEPSPYAPASRIFGNEFYLDIKKIPELRRCKRAEALLSNAEFKHSLQELKSSSLIDYRNGMRLKRKILELLSEYFFRSGGVKYRKSFSRFVNAHPLAKEYASFRAVGERRKTSWVNWPKRMKSGSLRKTDYQLRAERYHLYVQWLADEQLEKVSKAAGRKGVGLFLDFPLGVNPDSFDVWREQKLFARGVRVGAPPDLLFTKGQDWGFPPLHPEAIRLEGYRYFVACLRYHLRYARFLRIDHVMGFHHLFWIPRGFSAEEGVYVQYRPEEFYAILALESHRSRSLIVGENLGIVPPEVTKKMAEHGIYQLYITQCELISSSHHLRTVPKNAVASLNTHDMPPFTAFWKGLDIPVRVKLGLLEKQAAKREEEQRESLRRNLVSTLRSQGRFNGTEDDIENIIKASLGFLAESQAPIVLVNLEDLWLEEKPQNIPSTYREYPNWQYKFKYSREDFAALPQILNTLGEIGNLRKESVLGR